MSPPAIAVVCAMESEAVHLRRRLAQVEELPLARWRRTRGALGAATVDLVVGGIGLVNVAAATSALLVLDRPEAVLNYGCAGAHREDIAPGDVVIADQVVHFSAQIVLPDGQRRYMGFDYYVDQTRVQEETIRTDPALLRLARRAADELALLMVRVIDPTPDHLPEQLFRPGGTRVGGGRLLPGATWRASATVQFTQALLRPLDRRGPGSRRRSQHCNARLPRDEVTATAGHQRHAAQSQPRHSRCER